MGRRLGGVVIALVLGLAAGASARDEGLSPPEPDRRNEVGELLVTGLEEDMAEEVAAGLALAPRGGFLGKKKQPLTPGLLEEDRRRILLWLARNGFPDATVTTEIEPLPEDDGQRVTFVVSAGDPLVYGNVTLTGFPPGEEAAARARAAKTLLPGERFRDEAVEGLRTELVLQLRRAAYYEPEVAIAVDRAGAGRTAVTYAARPGRRGAFTEVHVTGVPEEIDPLVRRTIDLEPGTPYSPEVLDRTEQVLRDLDIFRRVDAEAVPLAAGDLQLHADVTIRPMVTVSASVGSWTDDWLRVAASWEHRNFFRKARGLDLSAAYSAHLLEATALAWWPALMTPRSRADVSVSYRIEDEESYRLAMIRGGLTNLFSLDPKTSLRAGVEVSHGDLENRSADPAAFVDDVGLQTVLTGRWFRDAANDALVPSQGHRLGLEVNLSVPGVITDNPFLRVRANEARYVPLVTDRLVLAGRVDVGAGWPLGEAVDLTPNRRFFAGGVSTMRGYRRRELGPRDVEGKPIGGEAQVLAGLELRQQLIGIFGAAAFVDAGQVWRESDAIALGSLEYAAGGGLMITTPIGPIRLDAAYNLTEPPPGEPRFLLQLGIGHPY